MNTRLKSLLLENDPAFWVELRLLTEAAATFETLIGLSAMRRKAVARGLKPREGAGPSLRLAILGGYSLYPLHELLVHLLETVGVACELFLGDYDNYTAEIMEADGALQSFKPDVILILPGAQRCKYPGQLTDPRELIESAADSFVTQLLELCRTAHERSGAEVLLGNFTLPARHDPGSFRSRTLASDWSYRKRVNLELGLRAPPYVRICDLEFLAARHGGLAGEDARRWFESKQPCAPALLVEICREAARLVLGLRAPAKKVLVTDLDNTLWGGVVAEEGVEHIEIGDTSPRGEAFKAFQKYLLSLKQRGVLLAVCSKNDQAVALEPFEKHPEMVLKPGDFVAFKANWEPKSDNLRQLAAELELGLDGFVFVDDNPAEIEIVRQFTPAVTAILLGPDPADYVGQLQDARCFEPHSVTAEDLARTTQYRAESERRQLLGTSADMDAYLESLDMEASVRDFAALDVPRLAQLINKSNQFNLTTRRRTEAEVHALIGRGGQVGFSVRLKDRFGDHGLISIAIGCCCGTTLEIDTWLMSCRVLKRQVEDVVLNELAARAKALGCSRLAGVYLPTAKNQMVCDFYPRIGFQTAVDTPGRSEYTLDLGPFQPHATKIKVRYSAYEPG